MNLKLHLKKIGIGAVLLGGIGLAPLGTTSNGINSVSVFRDNTTHEMQYYQMIDAQYDLMGKKNGEQENPASTTATWLYSFQYPANDIRDVTPSATNTPERVRANKIINTFKDEDKVPLYKVLIPKAHASVAFDSNSTGTATGATSLTYSHAFSGSTNPYLVVGVANMDNVDDIQRVTFNAVTMATSTIHSTGGSHQYVMGLAGTAGTHNVVITKLTASNIDAIGLGYTGVIQTNAPDNSGNAQQVGTQVSLTITGTSLADNAWMVLFYGWQRTPTAGTGTTQRQASTNSYAGGDSNAVISPAGTNNMTFSFASCTDGCMSGAWVTLAPVVVATSINQGLITISDE